DNVTQRQTRSARALLRLRQAFAKLIEQSLDFRLLAWLSGVIGFPVLRISLPRDPHRLSYNRSAVCRLLAFNHVLNGVHVLTGSLPEIQSLDRCTATQRHEALRHPVTAAAMAST